MGCCPLTVQIASLDSTISRSASLLRILATYNYPEPDFMKVTSKPLARNFVCTVLPGVISTRPTRIEKMPNSKYCQGYALMAPSFFSEKGRVSRTLMASRGSTCTGVST